MPINSIGQINNYEGLSFGSLGGISESTRRKLIALGIDPRTVTSEAQAQILIKEAIKIRKNAKIPLPLEVCYGEQELISKAHNFASKMGVSISDSVPMEQILKIIADKINSGGFDEYKEEFVSIENAFKTVKKHESDMYASMIYKASLNKIVLGL